MKDFTFQIGQLVAIKNHPYFEQKTNILRYIGTTIVCSSDNYPIMLVKECILSISKRQEVDKSYNEVQEKDYWEEKFICSWYDSTIGKFQEACFKVDDLVNFPNTPITDSIIDSSKLHKIIFLKTSIIERYKQVANQSRMNDKFVSSSFLIKDFNTLKQYEWNNNKIGCTERLISKNNVKVQWYNVAKSKYSEEWLPTEFFQEFPHLVNIERNTINNEPEFQVGIKIMDLISDSNFNFHRQNSEEGKSLEDLIYYYIISNRNVILDERVHVFDQYLSKNKLTVINYKIHINSAKYDSFKPFYAPLDLLLENDKKELIAIDLISGNSLLKDDNIQPLTKTPENKEELSGLALYNGRAFVIQELLKKKYEMPNVSSKLLIINSKLPNLIKELPVLECAFSLGCVQKEAGSV